MAQIGLRIEAKDPLSEEALFLLHEAALEARRLYSDVIDSAAPMPTNQPLRLGDIYLIAFLGGNPVGCGALRKLDDRTAELRRMYALGSGGVSDNAGSCPGSGGAYTQSKLVRIACTHSGFRLQQ